MCLHCVSNAPLFAGSTDDLRHHRLPRTAPISAVRPWLAYSNADSVCRLIRDGKFNDRPELIEELSRRYAIWLTENGFLDSVDLLVPVPMHWWKRLLRGYNQAEIIARGVSRLSGIPIAKALRACRSHAVQSRQSGARRAENVKGIFGLTDCDIEGKHIAVVDDILTTGSTLSEAITTLMQGSPKAVAVLTLAATSQ